MNETRRDHVAIIAIWELLTVLPAGWLTAFFVMLTVGGHFEAVHSGHGDLVGTAISIGVMLTVGLGYASLGLLGGIGLLRGDEWGRKLSLAHAVASLVLIPIGTVAGALALRYLTRASAMELVAARKRPAPAS